MARMLPWLCVPVALALLAPAAWADTIVTKSGDKVEGTILSESQLGVTIVDPAGLPHTYFHDEIKEIHVSDTSNSNVATGAVRSVAEQAAHEEEADMAAEAARELAAHQHRPLLQHELSANLWGTSLGAFVPAAYAQYRLLIGDYLAAYVSAGGGTALSGWKVPLFDSEGNPLVDDATGLQKTKTVTTNYVDLPFGLEVRLGGAYVGGGASYLMPHGIAIDGSNLKTQIVPNVVFGYEYQFPTVFGYTYRRPSEAGHFIPSPHGLSLGIGARYGVAPTPFYGGTLYAGWTF